MKKTAIFVMLLIVGFAASVPAQAQRITPEENAKLSQKASKKQQKAMKKSAKKQQKAMRKSAKAQRKALERAHQSHAQ